VEGNQEGDSDFWKSRVSIKKGGIFIGASDQGFGGGKGSIFGIF
jgi:hypothetical protein